MSFSKVSGASLGVLGLLSAASAASGADPAPVDQTTTVRRVVVTHRPEDTRAKLEFIQREVDGAKITVTRKSTVTLLDRTPADPDQDARVLFVRTPGVLADPPAPAAGPSLSYRGLGASGLLVLQDGLPIADDFIGAPNLDYTPLVQSVAQAQTLRAGSSLVYGPEIASINFVSRRPTSGAPFGASTEQVGGSNGLWSSYSVVEGSRDVLDYRADLGWTRSDGQRLNGGSVVGQSDAYLGWRPGKGRLVYLDLQAYRADAGDPGPMGLAQFQADPHAATTPFNHDWIGRYAVTLGSDLDLGRGWRFEGKARAAYMDLFQRAASPEAPGGPEPTSTTLQDATYRNEAADVRLRKSWGRGNALTFGFEAFHDSAPLRQWVSGDIDAQDGDHSGATPRLRQQRVSDYQSVFLENVFRLPWRIHVTPSARLEHETIDVAETVKPAGLTRPLIDVGAGRTTPLFGLGFGNDFGKDNETYFSVTQGWRPLRFFDLASPFTNAQPTSTADGSRSLSWEAGVHGTPLKGLFYDASLFWIDVKNRVETQALSVLEARDLNTGDTRNRGFEGQIAYDFLASSGDGAHFSLFASLALLDARFVKSALPDQVGRVPAYAPHALAKTGLTWRKDRAYDLSLSVVSVSSQFFQDSNQAAGSGAGFVPADIPGHTLVDLSGDYWVTRRIRLLAGLRNLGDVRTYAQASQIGLTPLPGLGGYLGLALGF